MPPVTHLPRNPLKEIAAAAEGNQGWAFHEGLWRPAAAPDPFRPGDEVLMEFARLRRLPSGQALLGWLHLLTDRAPYPAVTLKDFEQAALAAAKHEGRAAVGHVLAFAEAEGERLYQSKTNQGTGP